MVKNMPSNAEDIRDKGLITGSGRSSEGRYGNPPVFLSGESHGQMSLGATWGLQSISSYRVRHD